MLLGVVPVRVRGAEPAAGQEGARAVRLPLAKPFLPGWGFGFGGAGVPSPFANRPELSVSRLVGAVVDVKGVWAVLVLEDVDGEVVVFGVAV